MSRLTSLSRKPFVPTLPIEIWFKAKPFFRWEVAQSENDWVFQCSWPFSTSYGKHTPLPAQMVRSPGKDYKGSEFVADLLRIREPYQLAAFMNQNGNPLDETVEYSINEEYHRPRVPFLWSDFVAVQRKLRDAMALPVHALSQQPDLRWAFTLTEFSLAVTQRKGHYYGIVKTRPSLPWYYRVIAVNRLLGEVRYKFCLRCGNPFAMESRHKRKYCPFPAPCGHAVAQEKYRKRQRSKTRQNRVGQT